MTEIFYFIVHNILQYVILVRNILNNIRNIYFFVRQTNVENNRTLDEELSTRNDVRIAESEKEKSAGLALEVNVTDLLNHTKIVNLLCVERLEEDEKKNRDPLSIASTFFLRYNFFEIRASSRFTIQLFEFSFERSLSLSLPLSVWLIFYSIGENQLVKNIINYKLY